MGDTEAIWTVPGTQKVVKVSRTKVFKKYSAPLALCNGSAEGGDASVEKSSCFIEVDTLENQLEALKMLRMEIEAQT